MPLFGRLFQPVVDCSFSLPSPLSLLARGDLNSVFTVRGEYTVATGSVDPGFRRQGCQPRNKIQWLKDHMGCAIPVGRLERVTNLSIWS